MFATPSFDATTLVSRSFTASDEARPITCRPMRVKCRAEFLGNAFGKYAWFGSAGEIVERKYRNPFPAFAAVDFRRNQPPAASDGGCSHRRFRRRGCGGTGRPAIAEVHAGNILAGNASADRPAIARKRASVRSPFQPLERNGLDLSEPERRFYGIEANGQIGASLPGTAGLVANKVASSPTERLLHATITHFAASRCCWISSRQWVPPPI